MSARILVVDDAPVNVRLLHAKLTAEYFDVVTAEDGPSALAVMEVEPPDIVLLDVMMPGMTGFEVCRRIKADPRWTHIPVVMVTDEELDPTDIPVNTENIWREDAPTQTFAKADDDVPVTVHGGDAPAVLLARAGGRAGRTRAAAGRG